METNDWGNHPMYRKYKLMVLNSNDDDAESTAMHIVTVSTISELKWVDIGKTDWVKGITTNINNKSSKRWQY